MKAVKTFEQFIIESISTTSSFPQKIEILKVIYVGNKYEWTTKGPNKDKFVLEPQIIELTSVDGNEAGYDTRITYPDGVSVPDEQIFTIKEINKLYKEKAIK